MPPRHNYWTIIFGNQPTSFRAATQEELLPTFKQLQAKHPDAVMMWFASGRLWKSEEEARQARESRWSRDKDHPRGPKPAWQNRGPKPEWKDRPQSDRPRGPKPEWQRSQGDRPSGERPPWQPASGRKPFKRGFGEAPLGPAMSVS